jgi:hypothetical protein
LLCSLPPRGSCRPESCCPLRPMPVATGWARLDIIGIGTAPVLTGSTHTGASAGMAVAGIGSVSGPFSASADPLYPRKRTFSVASTMSAKCQKRTHAVQQKGPLFDHLVGARKHGRRHSEAHRLGGFKIDHQLAPGRRLHRRRNWSIRSGDPQCPPYLH